MKLRNFFLPLMLVSLLFGAHACLDNAAGGSEFVGEWESVFKVANVPMMKCQISHNSGNQYFVTLKPFGSELKEPAFFKNGMLEFQSGAKAIIDKKTGMMNLGGQDFTKK